MLSVNIRRSHPTLATILGTDELEFDFFMIELVWGS